MKNILNYYYGIIIDESSIKDNGYFWYNKHLFCLYEYKRNILEIEALVSLNKLMLERKIPVNKIISNLFNQTITYHNNRNYCLLMVNNDYKGKINITFIKSFINSNFTILKRCDWGKLWSIKIDYIEYQLSHIKNSYPIINSSVNYYIGLAENAVSYFNMLNLNNIDLFISHRRINEESIYNPLELVIDYKMRDVGEYIKYNFFNGKMSIYDVKEYLKGLELENIDYLLLYNRLLFPSYYFDTYEKIINNKMDEKEINKIINMANLYEELLYEIYRLFNSKINILGIDWINSKYM